MEMKWEMDEWQCYYGIYIWSHFKHSNIYFVMELLWAIKFILTIMFLSYKYQYEVWTTRKWEARKGKVKVE